MMVKAKSKMPGKMDEISGKWMLKDSSLVYLGWQNQNKRTATNSS